MGNFGDFILGYMVRKDEKNTDTGTENPKAFGGYVLVGVAVICLAIVGFIIWHGLSTPMQFSGGGK